MQIINQIIREIQHHDKIIILRHVLPDGDAYGSQLGLKRLIEHNFPNKQVYAFGEPVTYLDFIGQFDVMQNPNIFTQALVIVTDCGNLERIDNQHFPLGKTLIKIDHHPDVTPYGDVSWVDTSFTSASEMIGFLAIQAQWKMTPDIARVLYHGICTDSGRFVFGNLSARTFEVCAQLLKQDFDVHKLYRQMYTRDLAALKLQAEVLQTAIVTPHGVGYVILSAELMHKYHLSYDDNGRFSNLLKDITGIDIWITFSARQDKQWRVELRSATIPINTIAIKWGGGGHLLASGAIVKTLTEAMQIVEEANQLIKNTKTQLHNQNK